MKSIIKFICIITFVLFIQGCNLFENTLDKQVTVCKEYVKLGLGNPGSLEIVSSKGFELDNGWYRVELNFTAKML